MNALFIIDACPVKDRRAREALRIAAGISPWGKVRPTICFSRGIGQALGQADDPEIRRYLTLLRETSGGLFTLTGDGSKWLKRIDKDGLAKLETDADTVLRFGSGA